MKKLNLLSMYWLGKRLAFLENAQNNAKVKTHLFDLWWARSQLQEAIGPESPLLEATRRSANVLINRISEVIPTDFSKASEISNEAELDYHAYWLRKSLEGLEAVLSNEMPGCPAYIVSQKGIYRTEALIDQADSHLHPDLAQELPEQAKLDLREAGRSLAFELPTACSFHLWRAVESTTDQYYETLTGKTFEADKVARNWWAKIHALQEAKADQGVTAFLDHIREHYRNPQTHPERMVPLKEAQMLFGTATSALAQLVSAIQALRSPRSGDLTLIQGGS